MDEDSIQCDAVTQTIAFQCRNCGLCCGPVPFSAEDKKRAINYLLQMDKAEMERCREQLKARDKNDFLTCGYRDVEKRRCFIHPVRPEICRMMGYYEGLACPHQPQFATKSKEEGWGRLGI